MRVGRGVKVVSYTTFMGGCLCVGYDAVIYNVQGWVCGIRIFNVKRWRGCRTG